MTVDETLGADLVIAQTTVLAPDRKAYQVSTLNREASTAPLAGHRYAETIVWRVDSKTGKRGEMFGPLDEDLEGAISAHVRIAQRIRKTGQVELEERHE